MVDVVTQRENERGRVAVEGRLVADDELRASLCCGRSLPVQHLVESDEAFTQRNHWRELNVLCGADVAKSDVEYLDCPGCRDCLRYCPDCVLEAARFSASSGAGVVTSGAG